MRREDSEGDALPGQSAVQVVFGSGLGRFLGRKAHFGFVGLFLSRAARWPPADSLKPCKSLLKKVLRSILVRTVDLLNPKQQRVDVVMCL